MKISTTPLAAGASTPRNNEALAGDAAQGFFDQNKNTSQPILTELDAERKVFLTLRAKLALAGKFGLFELAGGDYLVTLSGYTKSLPDLRAVAAFLRSVSGARQ